MMLLLMIMIIIMVVVILFVFSDPKTHHHKKYLGQKIIITYLVLDKMFHSNQKKNLFWSHLQIQKQQLNKRNSQFECWNVVSRGHFIFIFGFFCYP